MTVTYKLTGKTVNVDAVNFSDDGNLVRFHNPQMGWSPWVTKNAIESIGEDTLTLGRAG